MTEEEESKGREKEKKPYIREGGRKVKEDRKTRWKEEERRRMEMRGKD